MVDFFRHAFAVLHPGHGVNKLNNKPNAVRRFAGTVIKVLLLVFAALATAPAKASLGCSATGLSKTIVAGTVSIPAGAAPGSTVLTLPSSSFQNNCTLTAGGASTGTIIMNLATVTAPTSGFSDVYPTNIDGLGVRYTFNSDAICDTTNLTMKNKAIAISCVISGVPGGAHIYANATVTPSLVVTGAVKGGASTLSSSPIVSFTYTIKDVSGSWPAAPLYTGAASGAFSAATCSVQTVANAITLPNVATRSFSSGVGAIAGRQPFNLSFSCTAGAQVSIVITDAVDPSNRSNVLNLAPDSTAKGIGVQILRDATTLVVFGPEAAGPSVANQWLIGASPNGLLQLPLSAQYIRTGTLGAGSVKAMATFTMSYQ